MIWKEYGFWTLDVWMHNFSQTISLVKQKEIIVLAQLVAKVIVQ